LTAIPSLGERLNPVVWEELDALYERLAKPFIEPFWKRRKTPLPRSLASLRFSDRLNLLALSPLLCQQQEDWNGLHVVTGAMRVPSGPDDWSMSEALREFLDSGAPPVFMGFGSTQQIYPDTSPLRNMQLLLGGALRSGHRAIVQVPVDIPGAYEVDARYEQSEDIFFVERIPYGEIFQHCAAVVHHGGAGTCDLVMRSGRPSIVVPFTHHQYFLGYEMHRLGIALEPEPFHEATPAGLACSIRELTQNRSYARKAMKLREEGEPEDGVRRGVEVIERCIESGRLRR
jgi:UDP:flavonoid glycosyltransferase YjiC (YdhE family)